MMNIKMPQATPQEIAGAQMQGVSFLSMKWVLLVLMGAIMVIAVISSYEMQWRQVNQREDYRIIGCEVEEQGTYYELKIQVESLNGHEQTIEIYQKEGTGLQRITSWEMESYLPAGETAVVTYRIQKEQVQDGKILLELKTYKPQVWEVTIP